MTTLITGSAGFIGFHVAQVLLGRGEAVIGIDNLNNYYDVSLKHSRLKNLQNFKNFDFHKLDIVDREALFQLVGERPEINRVVHLAAQAGVRHSLVDPYSYTATNVEGHLNLMEAFRKTGTLEHFVFASSSSVYGANTEMPFSIDDRVDTPLSLYAATKKSMEMMSHCYSHLFNIPLTGLRFFTVYGPWGRPDMAMFIFTRKILAGESIQVFNKGDMRRDFTYIDDIVDGVVKCLDRPPADDRQPPYRVYNIGNNKSEKLMDMVRLIEKTLDKKAEIEFLPMQEGDFKESFSDIKETQRDFGFNPKTTIEKGIPLFVDWYKEYYSV